MKQQDQKRVMAPVFIAMFVSMALLLAFQLMGSVERDPLYTDLTASNFYAINGFLPSYANITDPGDLIWDLIRPPRGGSLIMADLPSPDDSAKYGRFSTAVRETEEFTIYIPFILTKEKYDELWGERYSYPAIYLIGIGENWEIYLNGHSIAREIYQDKSGNITKFRSVYKISIPIDKSILRENGNDLVIHIVGARSSKWTGLRYVSPYYIGDTSHIANSFTGNDYLILCAVFLFAGLYNLLIYALHKTSRYNLFYTICTTIASAYYFFKMPIAHSIISNTEYLERLDYSLLYLFVIMFCAFIDSINYGKVSKPAMAYSACGSLFAIVQWFVPIWSAYAILSVWQFITLAFLVYFFIFRVLRRLLKGAAEINKDAGLHLGMRRSLTKYLTATEFGNVSILLFLIVPTALIDIVNLAVFNVNLSLSQYSYLGIVLCMAYILTRNFPNPNAVFSQEIMPEISGTANEQDMIKAGLTPDEVKVALLLLDGAVRRDISRKLNLKAAVVAQHEKEIRQKLGLMSGHDSVIAIVAAEYRLTKRETEMLQYLSRGAGNDEIAAELFLSDETIKTHIRNLMLKLPLENRHDVPAWLEAYSEKDE